MPRVGDEASSRGGGSEVGAGAGAEAKAETESEAEAEAETESETESETETESELRSGEGAALRGEGDRAGEGAGGRAEAGTGTGTGTGTRSLERPGVARPREAEKSGTQTDIDLISATYTLDSPLLHSDEVDPSRRETAPLGRAAKPQRETDPAPPPERIGRYEIRGELGRGGVGVVYDAWDPRLEREVALKTLIAGRDASNVQIERFLREVRASARLRHPHIVSVHDAGVIAGCFYLAMDRISGSSLARLLEREGPLPPRRAAELLLPIARALEHAHREGLLHRDVKPENILVDAGGIPYLTDFGLAVDLGETERLTHTHQSLGTPAFMAPEQLRGQHRDPRVDVYGLGATLFECLTGRLPFQADTFPELVHQILHHDPPSPRDLNPRLAPDLAAVVTTCLEKDPLRRYASPGLLADDLARFLAGEGVHARAPSAFRRIQRRVVRNRALVTGLLVALAGLAAGGAGALSIRGDVERELDRTRHLEEERGRLLEAQRQALVREEREQDRRAAFARASLAPTLSSQAAAYTEVLERYPEAWEALVARARVRRELCHQRRALERDLPGALAAAQGALADLEAALPTATDKDSIRLYMAELLRADLRDAPAARRIYEGLLRSRDPGLVAYAAGRLALPRDPGEAARLARRALSAGREPPGAALLLAEALLAEGLPEDALEAVDEHVGALGGAEAVLLRGEALRRLGALEDAEHDAVRARELDPTDPRAYLLVGRLRLDRGDPGRALAALEEGARVAHQGPTALLVTALARLRAWRDLPRAIELIAEARRAGVSSYDPDLRAAQRELERVAADLGETLPPATREALGLPDLRAP
ncbi:MAG: protein kinase [Planctomycetota bacterium]